MPKDARNDFNQTNTLLAAAMDRYSASAEDMEAVVCFFVFQEIGEPPSVTKYPVKERRVSEQAPHLSPNK